MTTRMFSGADEFISPVRIVEDAPLAMRIEFLDIAFSIAERESSRDSMPRALYHIVTQTLGIDRVSADPSSGYRLRTQRYIEAEWRRFYDVVLRLWREFLDFRGFYHENVNNLLAAYGIAWEMTEDGQLRRVLPAPIAQELQASIEALRAPGYESALQLFGAALDAFNAIPRRDRDAGTNAFDAMEAASKVKCQSPNSTFGAVLSHVRTYQLLNSDVREVLEKLNTLRHHHLGHGMTDPFSLTSGEVDFVFLSCAAGARLFASLP